MLLHSHTDVVQASQVHLPTRYQAIRLPGCLTAMCQCVVALSCLFDPLSRRHKLPQRQHSKLNSQQQQQQQGQHPLNQQHSRQHPQHPLLSSSSSSSRSHPHHHYLTHLQQQSLPHQ